MTAKGRTTEHEKIAFAGLCGAPKTFISNQRSHVTIDTRLPPWNRSWQSIPDGEPDAEGPLPLTRPHAASLTARIQPPCNVILSVEERDKHCPSPKQLMEQDAKDALLLMDAMRHLRHHSGITRDLWSEFDTTEQDAPLALTQAMRAQNPQRG